MPEKVRLWMRALDQLPELLAHEALEWSDENFDLQQWRGTTNVPWANKRPKRGGRNLVNIDSNRMRKSGNYALVGNRIRLTYGNEIVPYARIHNEGLTVQRTNKQHSRVSRRGRKYTQYAMSQKVKYPENRFIGASPQLDKRLRSVIRKELKLRK